MSATIPQKNIVERNGKTFLQTFYIKTDNASSAAVAKSRDLQPQVSTEREFDISPEAMHALNLFKKELDYSGNVEDFVNGFNRSFENGETDSDQATAQYLSDNDPEEVNQR